jgi:hypothetical protein
MAGEIRSTTPPVKYYRTDSFAGRVEKLKQNASDSSTGLQYADAVEYMESFSTMGDAAVIDKLANSNNEALKNTIGLRHESTRVLFATLFSSKAKTTKVKADIIRARMKELVQELDHILGKMHDPKLSVQGSKVLGHLAIVEEKRKEVKDSKSLCAYRQAQLDYKKAKENFVSVPESSLSGGDIILKRSFLKLVFRLEADLKKTQVNKDDFLHHMCLSLRLRMQETNMFKN